ncbi:MAG TPA: hypothetical protein GXX42_03745 [Petrimonas sp.]|uniref:tellurite resistance TerB C-terminal domain-containing protein n=1 Tax=Petrimonas sp. TaxID=2023866 RepID=UPI001778E3C1|nr:hypothetical protein [Petrimonas sp.]
MNFFWALIVILVLIYAGVPLWTSGLIVAVIWLIVSVAKKSGKDNNKYSHTRETHKQSDKEQIINSLLFTGEYKLPHGNDENTTDDSVIDVSGEYFKLDRISDHESPLPSQNDVPYWSREYVYSTRSLEYSSAKIKDFYKNYKEAFLTKTYLDLKGNDNYSFTLMFDLLGEYDRQPDLTILTRQMLALIKNYPETTYYAERNLIERAKKSGRRKVLCTAEETSIEDIQVLFPDSREWTFSDRYAEKLNLSAEECNLFDYFESEWDSMYSNSEFMKIKHVQLFRDVTKALREKYRKEGRSLEKTIYNTAISFNIKSRNGSYDHSQSIYIHDNLPVSERIKMVNSSIFRLCRNKLYERYGLNSNIGIFTYAHNDKSKNAITGLLTDIEQTMMSIVTALPEFTDEEEIIINSIYTTRWRNVYQQITESFNNDVQYYIRDITRLAKLNKENPGLRHLLFDASKFLTGKDNIAALKMYLHYVDVYHCFFKDAEKPLPKYICKKLFKQDGQQNEFEEIVRQYKENKNRDEAFNAIEQIFLPKRKKLDLNSEEISRISEQYSETLQLLNEVMNEEDTSELIPPSKQNIIKQESNKNESLQETKLELDSSYVELLGIFAQNDHTLTKLQVEDFARSKGMMVNGLIDQINEQCYDLLDDVLIEEDVDSWTVLENYLKKIVTV